MENDILQINNPYQKLLPETIGLSNDIINAASPKKIHNLYTLGLVNGVLINTDHDNIPWNVKKYAEYNFQFLKNNQKDNQSIIFEDTKYYTQVQGTSKGQRVSNVQYLKIDPTKAGKGNQATGDCVSWGIRDALDQLRAKRISLGKWEAYIKRQATALIYKSRGYNGQGADSVELSANAIELGTLLEEVYKTTSKTYDFTNYDSYVSWGMNGSSSIPQDLLEQTKPYHGGGYKIVATTDALADAMFAGCTAHCGSMLGVASYGNPISKRSGSWSHDMNIYFFDDTDFAHSKFGGRIFGWNQSWGCLTPDTEVLTSDGWKLIKNITIFDEVYTLNQNNHNIEIYRPSKVHKYDFDGSLHHYKCRGIDLLVTPNHKMYIGQRDSVGPENFKLLESQNITSKFFSMKKDGKWSGAYILAHEMEDGTRIDMDLWLEFLGYFLSEGHVVSAKKKYVLSNGEEKSCNRYEVGISQTKIENLETIQDCLNQLPFESIKTSGGWTINSKALWKELKAFGKSYEKYIPNYVWECSTEQLNILFEAMMLGDGTRSSTKTTYYTSSPQLADDFSRLCLHVGYAGDVHVTDRTGKESTSGNRYVHKEYSVGVIVRDNNPCPADGWAVENYDYTGEVYCLTVPNHIFYVRRNGNTCWTGNSWNSVDNIPEEWKPYPEGAFWLSDRDTQYAVSDGGCVVFFDGSFFNAEPLDNLII